MTVAKKTEETPAPSGPSLAPKRSEQKQVEERTAIGANVVYEAIRREGEEELKRSSSALAWSGLAAGLSMGFSLIAEALLAAYLPDQSWRPLIAKFGYSVGFLIVILGRQQLFTENTLTVVLPLLRQKDLRRARSVLRLWAIVLGSNLVGTYLFALCVAKVHIFTPHIQQTIAQVSRESPPDSGSFWSEPFLPDG